MCDHTNDPGGREAAMVTLDPGTPEHHGRDGVWCDPCLVPIVKALNEGGIRTVASCCGHRKVYGSIALADGRWLTIMPDADWRAWDAQINQPQIAAQEPAGATQGGSGGPRASGGLGERLRAAADYQDRPGAYGELRAMADEADEVEAAYRVADAEIARLGEFHDHYRAQVEAIRAAITREAAHGDAITRCNLVAERFQTVLDSVTAP